MVESTPAITATTGDNVASSATDAAAPSALGDWQFSLRGLLVLSSVAAVTAAIAAARGAASVVLSIGMALSAANACGYLKRVQTTRGRHRLASLGWLLFLTSMFLPSVEGCNGYLYGWQVGYACVAAQYDAVGKIVQAEDGLRNVADQPVQFANQHWMLGSITIANLIMFALPGVAWLWQRDRGNSLTGLIWLGACSAWFFSWMSSHGLFIGYFVWSASLMVTLCARRLSWRWTLVGWCVTAELIIAALLNEHSNLHRY